MAGNNMQREILETQELHELIAPELIGNTFAKKILVLQMFTIPASGEHLNLLLCGSPASGKSVLAIDISRCIPISSYSSSNLTRIGLLEVLINTDGGLCVIDEFEKKDKATQEALLESMQTGKVSIDKFGCHTQRDAKINVMALMNPVKYILDDKVPIHNQTRLSLPLLTRFHLMIPFYSVPEHYYPDIALKYGTEIEKEQRQKMIFKHVVEIQKNIPVVNVNAQIRQSIGSFVQELKAASPLKEIVSPRLIEGVFSLVKARARMNKRNAANTDDLNYVRNLVEDLFYMRIKNDY